MLLKLYEIDFLIKFIKRIYTYFSIIIKYNSFSNLQTVILNIAKFNNVYVVFFLFFFVIKKILFKKTHFLHLYFILCQCLKYTEK